MLDPAPHKPSASRDLATLPGGDLVLRGLEDLSAGRDSVEAALVLVARARLNEAGFDLPESPLAGAAGHHLYDLLSDQDRATAHARYNALVQRLTSFLDTVGHAAAR